MIITLLGALLMSLMVVWFVLAPLFAAENMESYAATYKGFSDENELRQVLMLRDQLISRLTTGSSEEPRLLQLSDSECFQALVSLCLRLQRAELPFLPVTTRKAATSGEGISGFARPKLLLLLAALTLAAVGLSKKSVALGQVNHPPMNGGSPHGAGRGPGTGGMLHILEPGVFLPMSNRYIISPAEASVVSHYVSSFSVPSDQTSQFTLVFALPEGVYDWQIVDVKPEQLGKQLTISKWNGLPAVQMPSGIQGMMIGISSEFRLSAPTGRVVWKNEKLPPFAGEQVAVLFEIPGALKRVFGSMADDWNVWPPRISNPASGVELKEREITMGANASARRVQLVSREAQGPAQFFGFEIIGVVPSRLPLIILGALVAALLFGVALTVLLRRTRWRIDMPESLPG
ncbi:MAG: hypothetical protein ACO3A4_06885 [Silvanigrellaceae bacterium]